MRLVVLHLRWYLAHSVRKLALDPRAGTKVLKAGIFKGGGALSAALVIPVTAVATYTIPMKAIERMTAPIVGTAPDIFDVHGLTPRFRAALRAPGRARRALDHAVDVFAPGSSNQASSDTSAIATGDPGVLEAGSTGDQGAPPSVGST
jgi:hypothetical protein